MSTTAQKLETALAAVQSVPIQHRGPFVNVQALRSVLADRELNVRFHLLTHPAPFPLDIGNAVAHTYGLVCNNPHVAEFLTLKSLIAAAEAMPEVQEAERLFTPLIADVRSLEAQLADEELAVSRERQQRLDALAEAEAEALAMVRAAFAEPEPEAEPEPPAPFRGKGLKMASA
jgi:hypothetical protein